MELWIRSQDKKTLSIAKNIRLDRYLGGKENNIISNDFFEIGKYKTEERALEVLDEIQSCIENLGTGDLPQGISSGYIYDRRVYEMPKE